MLKTEMKTGDLDSVKRIFADQDLIKDIVEWDIENWSKALKYWCFNSQQLGPAKNAKALEIGARSGGLSLLLSRLDFDVICTDLQNPEVKASILHKKYNMTDKIRYQSADILNTKFSDNYFNIVTFKSVLGDLHTLERQTAGLKELQRILKPDGELWFAENLAASQFHQYLRHKYVPWGQKWRYLTQVEMKEILYEVGFRDVTFKTHGFLAAVGRSEKQKRLLGLVDTLICPLISQDMKYIIFGIAKK